MKLRAPRTAMATEEKEMTQISQASVCETSPGVVGGSSWGGLYAAETVCSLSEINLEYFSGIESNVPKQSDAIVNARRESTWMQGKQ